MMGTSHGWSGLMVGAATLPLAPVTGATGQAAWVAAVGGMALLPDADQGGYSMRGLRIRGNGSTIARLWGPITIPLSAAVGFAARGHRNGTHDPVVAPLVFAGAAALAALHPVGAFVLLAFVIGAAMHACEEFIPGAAEKVWTINLGVSLTLAAWFTNGGGLVDPGVLPGAGTSPLTFEWLPVAVALGVLVHIAGDWPTPEGVPVPFTTWIGKQRRTSLNLFTTGTWVERWLVAPTFMVVMVWQLLVNTGLGARLGVL